ncbi:iron-sulfur cluster assembly accessory protein [Planctopirus limnophila DSM 3776]|jgi:iron-sulfur cluster assembly accessory protein|uniref:Iron-sulfur cluster assembly accessory protein n=2 Tax=Planctopirus TaxID=1649480 RepID=D5SS76_PLAL2|nr:MULTISPECIES: iron-sulfur cluster assembly accessory protein [Planctopirus]ADG68800.1 iron-sulfur cluster assembly accessory protein [Planctopirus limnophila DSM 3776]QDV31790.1 Iron-sulfur cluster insertion protein ErpA [Planctopirus ephydatiae]
MPVTLTESAAKEIQRIISEQQMSESTLVRVGIAGGGCSGFKYNFGFEEAADPVNDHLIEYHGVKVAIDKKSALYLDGTTIDFYSGLDRRGFVFENPNAVKSCGCGSSFSA